MDASSEKVSSWSRMAHATGWLGIGSFILLFVPIIAISSVGEPALEASPVDIATFFLAAHTDWIEAAKATASLGMLVFLWFVVGVAVLLRRAEGEPAWRSTIALVSGVLLAAYGVLDASWEAAIHRGDKLAPGLAAYAFDVGNIGFANAWLAMASLAVSAGWVTVSTGVFPRWTGWCAIAGGVGLVIARYLWFVEGLWFAPYALFWVWAIAISVRLVRRPVGFEPLA